MFCSSCGNPVDPEDKFCSFCGAAVEMMPVSRAEEYEKEPDLSDQEQEFGYNISEYDEPPFAPESEDFRESLFSDSDFDEMGGKSAGTGEKTLKAAVSTTVQAAVQKASDIIPKGKDIGKSILKKKTSSGQSGSQREGLVSEEYSGSNYMAQKELWTWLKKDSKRQQFYTDEVDAETEDEYMEDLMEKLRDNQVPARVEKREISWDRNNIKESLYFVVPETNVVNPLSYIVQFAHVGKFTYVEEKTFITPPKLPPSPHEQKPVYGNVLESTLRIMGVGIALIAIGIIIVNNVQTALKLGILLILGGIIALCAGVIYRKNTEETIEYNKKCAKEQADWNSAWNRWQNSIFIHSFQEDVNGQLSRILDGVHTSINQLNDAKFKDMKTMEDRDKNDMAEIESMIKIKQQEYR